MLDFKANIFCIKIQFRQLRVAKIFFFALKLFQIDPSPFNAV